MRHLAKKTLAILFIVTMIVLLTPAYVKTAQAQQTTEKYEVIATLEQPTTIPSGSTITDLNFSVQYEISFITTFANQTTIASNQGLLGHWIKHQPTEVSLTDNLGNSFTPIISENEIESPALNNITVPANFQYKITLQFTTIDDCVFVQQLNSYEMAYTESQTGTAAPMSVTFRIPKDYSVFQNFDGANKSNDNQYNLLTWNIDSNNINCYAVFMPFSIEPTVRSMELTVKVLTNSANSGLEETFNMTYDLIGTVMIWNVSLVMPITIEFPTNKNGTQVESVFDGQGESELRTEPINPNATNPLGKYFVDNQNKEVIIYPRHSYQDTTQKFDVQITFLVPNPSNNINSPNIPFYEPYKGWTNLVFNFQNSPQLSLNMTGNFGVAFIFPQDAGSFSSPNGQFVTGETEDNRPTVTFSYNSPIILPLNQWIVEFDNISLRNFYLFAWGNNIVLIIAVAIMMITIKRVKLQGVPESITVGVLLFSLLGSVIANSQELLTLSSFPMFILVSWGIELGLSVALGYLMLQFYRKRVNKRPKSPSKFRITVPVKVLDY